MAKTIEQMKKLFLIITAIISTLASAQSLQRIHLNAEDFYPNFQNPNPVKGVMNLFDDDVTTTYALWSPTVMPVRFRFDLPQYSSCIIKQIKTLWNTGNPSWYKIIGIRRTDKTEVLLHSYAGNMWDPVLKSYEPLALVDISGLIIESSAGTDYPDLLELLGSYTNAPPENYTIKHYPIRNMLMINSHVYDYDSAWWYKPGQYEYRLKAYLESGLQGGRNYSDARIGTDQLGRLGFDPTCDGGFQPEIMYRDLKIGNPHWIRHICWQGPNKPNRQTYWAVGDSNSNLNMPYGADRGDPNSWADLGREGSALASRYGTNKNGPDYVVHPRELWYEKENEMLKGTGLADWLEPWNENNAWWDAKHCLTTNEMLASMSAFYDGHNRTISGAGVKNADPNMLVSSGGVASSDPWILHEGIDWVIKNRGYRADGKINWPFDFYQMHAYPSAGDQWSGTPGGLPGEKTLIPWGKTMVKAMHRYASGMPVGIGELGWDINPHSDINAPAHDGYSAETVRAQAAVRTVFKSSQIGLFFLEWYRLFQDDNFADNEPWTIIFRSMSLLKSNEDGTIVRRAICDYFKQLGPFLDYSYSDALIDNDSLQVLKFAQAGNRDIYPAWTIENTGIGADGRTEWKERKINYKFPFSKGTLLRFNNDSSGVMISQPYNGETITLTSSPIILIPDFVTLPVNLLSFTAEKINQAVVLKWIVQDADKVEVEKSIDGRNWKNLGEGILNKLVDMKPAPGKNYYRLKMYEEDGSYSYSFIIPVSFDKKTLTVEVINALGQTMLKTQTDNAELFIQQSKTLSLTPGFYIARFSDGANVFSKKFVK